MRSLTVVPMEGWMRGDWYDSTALPWINPSPNMRSLTEATLYPGVGVVEGTNVSVGRGTDTPFELLGAPWIKATELAQYLNAQKHFRRALCSDQLHSHLQRLCRPEMRRASTLCWWIATPLDAPELGMELASALHKLYPEQFHMDRMIELLANQTAYDAIAAGPGSAPHRRRLARAAGEISAGAREVPDLQVAHSLPTSALTSARMSLAEMVLLLGVEDESWSNHPHLPQI